MTRWQRFALRWIGIYPPFLGAGIRVRTLARAPLAFESSMRLHWWNRNFVRTHFGGSLYAMTDPFFMLLLIDALGDHYRVWDKESTIRYRRPGRGRVRARFEIPAARVEEIRREVDRRGWARPRFRAEIVDAAGETVAEVEKVLSIRRRGPDGASTRRLIEKVERRA